MNTLFASPPPASSPPAGLPPDLSMRPGKPPLWQVDDNGDSTRWIAAQRDTLRAAVLAHGALLVRGLGLRDAAGVEAAFRQLGTLLVAREAFAARQHYSDVLYSASKWPANQVMCQHHELSYALNVPSLLLFACLAAPTEGGATPLADGIAVRQALPTELVARFERSGWLLIRNYHDEIGATLAEAFGSNSRQAVESYCRANAIAFAWQPDGTLRTWQRRSAVVSHPASGQRCWFNQIAFLNQWTIDPEVRDYLLEVYGQDGLPFNTCFGNGEPIGPELIQQINQSYAEHTVREPWQAGDLLLVDNIRTAHGRDSYAGPREVLVSMADAVSVDSCAPTIAITGAP